MVNITSVCVDEDMLRRGKTLKINFSKLFREALKNEIRKREEEARVVEPSSINTNIEEPIQLG